MRKYRLQLDDLEIESFRTTPEVRPQAGTVHGHATGVDDSCGPGCGGNSMFTACLDCYTNANTCTMVEGCVQTRDVTCGTCIGC